MKIGVDFLNILYAEEFLSVLLLIILNADRPFKQKYNHHQTQLILSIAH